MRTVVTVALVLASLVPPPARALDLPVRDAARGRVSVPAYLGDRLEVRLTPAAAARAWLVRAATAGAGRGATPLGVAAVDAAAAALGAWLEPEFRGETPPLANSPDADFTAFYLAHLPEGADLETALARFGALAEVSSAEPIAVLPVSAVPNDSLWSGSWWYAQPSGHDIHATQAWDVTRGDSTIVVAILDSGVLPYHPDLGGVTAGLPGQLWTNWSERGGLPGVDDDGNGFVDDLWGWDFVDQASGANVLPFEDWRDQDNDPNDYAGHGTQVAGLVGALTDNGRGVVGTAWEVRLMPLRVAWATGDAPLGLVDMSAAAQAVRYATRMHADVINCSFASVDLSGLGAAVDAAIRAGVVIVAAAGNHDAPAYLGMRDDVIAVAATDMNDQVASFTTLGDWVDLAAPGKGIYSTFVAPSVSAGDSLGYRQPAYSAPAGLDGSSFAAPLVAGAVALLDAQQRALGLRALTPRGALLRLRETADDISAFNLVTGYGTGRLDVARALTDRTTSTAWRAGAATVGSGVPIPLTGPARKIAYVTTNSRLLIQDWRTGDTLALATLPGVPARQLAAADLGGGRGIGLFVGLKNGRIAGYDTSGTALPGFPRLVGGGALAGGPALGDLDGDGVLEVVCGAGDGRVWAWRADGTPVAGFPVTTDGSPIDAPVALSDLDGRPGVEILAAAQSGSIYAIDGAGEVLTGWPATVDPVPLGPVVTRFGRDTVALVVAGAQVFALRTDGSERSRWSLPADAAQDPALGDLNGDGSDEIVVPIAFPATLVVLDSSGVVPAGRDWPLTLAATPAGPPVLGHLRGEGLPDVLIMEQNGLAAYTDSAHAISRFPEPGGAGSQPTLADLLADGATRVVAGSASDSLLYVYDAGSGSAGTSAQPWPTPRGNYARTGSRLYPARDALAPAAVTDLAGGFSAPDSVHLTWTAPGDNGAVGRAAAYELRLTTVKAEAGVPGAGRTVALAPPDTAGTAESVTLAASAPGVTTWYWLRTHDAAGNVSAGSNVLALTRPLGPGLPADSTLTVRQRPARAPVTLDWRGAEATAIRLYDVTGRLVRTLVLSRGARGVAQWNGRDESGSLVPAGLYLARLVGGSLHAQTRIVLLP